MSNNYDYDDYDDGFHAFRAIQSSLKEALELPADPAFKELCAVVEDLHSCQGIINQIRKGFNNADDLLKIQQAIDEMREELIEVSAAEFERRTHP